MSVFGSLATWWFWAYYATGLFIMGVTLTVHLLTIKMDRVGPILLVIGAYLGMAGAIFGGIQAGPYPVVSQSMGVVIIRAFWVAGITAGIVASATYLWGLRDHAE